MIPTAPCLDNEHLAGLALDGVALGAQPPDHLARCARCRAAVDDMRDLAAALARPPVGAPEVDLVAGVLQRAALPPARRSRRFLTAVGFAAPAAAAALVLLAFMPGPSPSPATDSPAAAASAETAASTDTAGYQARGGAPGDPAKRWVALRPYRAAEGQAPVALPREGAAVRPGDALLLAYDNDGPSPYRFMRVVAIERTPGRAPTVHALFPSDGEPRAAIPIEPGRARELREELRLPLVGKTLALRALFSNEPLSGSQLDAASEALARGGALPPGVAADEIDVEIVRGR